MTNQETIDATLDGPIIRPKNKDDLVVIWFSKDKEQAAVTTCILKNKYVDEFLQFLSDAKFEITAASLVLLDKLDSKGLIRFRLYRDRSSSCKKINCFLTFKDLPILANASPVLLPPLELKYPKTVVLDLDKTLVHQVEVTRGDPTKKTYDFCWQGRSSHVHYILKRPFVDKFLQCLSENNYEIMVFTAASKRYASRVLDFLDPSRSLITHRLYHDSCYKVHARSNIKDLSRLGRDLRKVVIVDDRPISYSLIPKNAIPIKPFIDDLQDDELMNLMGYFLQHRDEEFFKEFEVTKDYKSTIIVTYMQRLMIND